MLVSLSAKWLEFNTINWILESFWAIWVVTIVVLFQPELRWMLSRFGGQPVFKAFYKADEIQIIDEIIRAAISMASRNIGALIVIERESNVENYFEAGKVLDSMVSKELLSTIFYPGSPLHDGAAVIRRGRILYAACFLPLSLKPGITRDLGTRHRAAIGLTEETDAVVVVVSEETGIISVAVGGDIEIGMDARGLRQYLYDLLAPEGHDKQTVFNLKTITVCLNKIRKTFS
jgi:diadenylate cyclase